MAATHNCIIFDIGCSYTARYTITLLGIYAVICAGVFAAGFVVFYTLCIDFVAVAVGYATVLQVADACA